MNFVACVRLLLIVFEFIKTMERVRIQLAIASNFNSLTTSTSRYYRRRIKEFYIPSDCTVCLLMVLVLIMLYDMHIASAPDYVVCCLLLLLQIMLYAACCCCY